MNSAKTMTIVMAMLFISMTAIQGAPEDKSAQEKNLLQVVCSPDLESLAKQLASDYMNENEGTQIQVTPLSEGDVYGNLPEGTVALLNKEFVTGLDGEHFSKMVVGRDAIVPIMNASHPQKEYILENGISPEKFNLIYASGDKLSWGEVLGIKDTHPVHAYAPGTSCAKNYMADFMQTESGNLNGFESMEPEKMLKMIGNDPGAIGFCSLACLLNMKINEEAGILLVPVDMDGNGQIGEFENIYKSASMLSRAIFVGRFPKALYSRIYALTAGPAAGAGEKAFLEWIFAEGQESLALAGIMELGYSERSAGLEHLSENDQTFASVPVTPSPARVFLLLGAFLFLLGVLVYALARMTGRKSQAPRIASAQGDGSGAFPGGLFFDSSHTWAFMEKSGRVKIGIDDFLQNVTGPLTRVFVKKPGEQIKRGDHFLTLIQNGKRLEIKSPVTGIIEEQNNDLLEDASLLNSDPYTAGWILMVKPLNWISELKSYLIGQPYTDWLKIEATRLKEFFASTMKLQDSKETALVLQDGGEIREGVLATFGPEVWEEFQNGFINNSK